MDAVSKQKSAWRRQLQKARPANVTAAERRQSDRAVCDVILGSDAYGSAKAVAAYAAMPEEIDLTPLMTASRRSGRLVLLPRYSRHLNAYEMVPVANGYADTRVGKYGIREPFPGLVAVSREELCNETVIWLVPGSGFDGAGNRLGRGGGFYDRLLPGVCGMKIGIAYTWQVVDSLPAAPHDIPVDAVVTPNGWLSCQRI